MKKHLVKFKVFGERKQRTVMAEDIYSAERQVRKEFGLSDYSQMMHIFTIKCGRTEYQVFGSTLG